jgi:regulator of cell morphogenesis and NO signaling
MNITASSTVRDIALEAPASIRVFEKFGIDYCCGGRKSLAEACTAAQLSLEQVLQKLHDAQAAQEKPEVANWHNTSFADLVGHLEQQHHKYLGEEIPRIAALAVKVTSRHGSAHPELATIGTTFSSLAQDLNVHMLKEEQVLFPYIVRMEKDLNDGKSLPRIFFQTVKNPVRFMMAEHDNAGEFLEQIRQLSNNFTAPADACPSYRAFYQGLQEFEQDLHSHVHLENNILFPRAIAMEEKAGNHTPDGGLTCGLHHRLSSGTMKD